METQVSAATIVQGDAASRRVIKEGRGFQPRRLDDASEAERPSLERTQQRIELQMKTANFHCMRRGTIAALRW